MEVVRLQRRYVEYTKSLFLEGYLDAQYTQLQQLKDESSPDFVEEVVNIFFEDSGKLVNDLTETLEQQVVDFARVDGYVHQLKGSSSSIGAGRVKNVCIAFRNCCEEQNIEGCLTSLRQIKQECSNVKHKFETLFMMEKQIVNAGGVVPTLG